MSGDWGAVSPLQKTMDRGSYLLIIHLPRDSTIRTKGKEFFLRRGFYIYVGSAMRNLKSRIGRHLRREKKKHWHIDFLLEKARIVEVVAIPSSVRLEEELSLCVARYGEPVEGFGSSDTGVPSNLYRFEENPSDLIGEMLRDMGLKWYSFIPGNG